MRISKPACSGHPAQWVLEDQSAWKGQIKSIKKEIEDTLDKIVEAENKSVIRAFEKRVDKLGKQKDHSFRKSIKRFIGKAHQE